MCTVISTLHIIYTHMEHSLHSPVEHDIRPAVNDLRQVSKQCFLHTVNSVFSPFFVSTEGDNALCKSLQLSFRF